MTPTAARPPLLVLLAVGVSLALAGCGGGGDAEVSSATLVPEPSTTTTSAPPVTAAAAPSTSARLATTTTAARPGSTTTTSRPAAGSSRPKAVQASQGDRVVAVFVATGASLADPSFAKARARLKAIGYAPTSSGDTDCSQGAREALPKLQAYSMSVEFATQADASRFTALYGPVLGTASVTVYCAD